MKPNTTTPEDRRSECPIACSLDILGDKWTLLVLRDLLDGKIRFGEFEGSPEGIPTNILAERLRRLRAAGLITREPTARSNRFTYHPTRQTIDLRPTLIALSKWGNQYLPNTWVPPTSYLKYNKPS